jgi:superfamily II DNA/RNA helicase
MEGVATARLSAESARQLHQQESKMQSFSELSTRELAMQVVAQYDALRNKRTQPAALVVGGLPERRQLEAIRRGAQLVVPTPGRLQDQVATSTWTAAARCTMTSLMLT